MSTGYVVHTHGLQGPSFQPLAKEIGRLTPLVDQLAISLRSRIGWLASFPLWR